MRVQFEENGVFLYYEDTLIGKVMSEVTTPKTRILTYRPWKNENFLNPTNKVAIVRD